MFKVRGYNESMLDFLRGSDALSRATFFDDAAMSAAFESDVTQVVSMAAFGFCSRVSRLPLIPGQVSLYELEILTDKRCERMEPLILDYMLSPDECSLRSHKVIPVDVENPPPKHAADPSGHWAELLLNEGYNPSLPSVWLLEGLMYYFNPVRWCNL